MLNYIWLGLVVLAVVIGGCTDRLKEVADASFERAGYAVMQVSLPMVGIMALWLGVMRLAERAGLVALLARGLRPLMCWLFPDVPGDHPAMGSMLLNMAASLLGLGNAATPLGLRAMRDLETLNPRPGTATNAMCTYLAINTSSIQLIPATAIAVLAANHAENPTAIVGTSIMATTCAAIAAVTTAKFLQHLPMFRLPPVKGRAAEEIMEPAACAQAAGSSSSSSSSSKSGRQIEDEDEDEDDGRQRAGGAQAAKPKPNGDASPVKEAATLQPLKWWGAAVMAVFGLFFVYLFVRLAFPGVLGLATPKAVASQTTFVRIVDAISKLSIPFLLSAFPLYAMMRHVKVYEEFVDGAKEGFDVAIRIIPYLIAILVAIGMFNAAGGIDMLSAALRPVMSAVGFPKELLPMVLMRPLSGSGTLGMFAELVKQSGPDSLVTRMGGTIYGSTETTFYVLAVYFGSVGIKRTRYAVLAGLTADFVGVVASIILCRLVFG